MEVPIKLLYPDSKLPQYSKAGDSCLDLFVHSSRIRDEVLAEKAQQKGVAYESAGLVTVQRVIGSGVAVAIPEGYLGLLFMRSSVCNSIERFTNAVGVIDENYRGEILAVTDLDSLTAGMFAATSLLETLLMDYEGEMPDELKEAIAEINEDHSKETDKLSLQVGDRFGQLLIIPRPTIELKVVDELPESVRGADGYGSSGR